MKELISLCNCPVGQSITDDAAETRHRRDTWAFRGKSIVFVHIQISEKRTHSFFTQSVADTQNRVVSLTNRNDFQKIEGRSSSLRKSLINYGSVNESNAGESMCNATNIFPRKKPHHRLAFAICGQRLPLLSFSPLQSGQFSPPCRCIKQVNQGCRRRDVSIVHISKRRLFIHEIKGEEIETSPDFLMRLEFRRIKQWISCLGLNESGR